MDQQRGAFWTIGHSTRTIDELIALLNEQAIQAVADVRHYPGSRRFPQFGREALAASLAEAGMQYVHFPELGGRRRADANSTNTAWRNEAFRGYADYMAGPEFKSGIERLVALGLRKRVAIMCAEVLWWRCHRALISDFLKAAGYTVVHVLGANKTQEHPFTSAARIIGGKLSYAA
ncbi:MAG TPA: DUF488 domain-containing protein [Patescibacteria group bacterium]|nr:DUF488 domain-containing protein [Patescibacteria group bacterium]